MKVRLLLQFSYLVASTSGSEDPVQSSRATYTRNLRAKPYMLASANETTNIRPSGTVPNDFWALHDLLLIGYSAVFMRQDSDGQKEVRQHAVDLARLLPQLHPHEPCRQMLTEALNGCTEDQETVVIAAEVSWNCLPGKFTASSFSSAFKAKAIERFESAFEGAIMAKMPKLRERKASEALGVCRGSQWPRACSYWTSLHSMALRADALGLSRNLLRATLPVLAGGATLCNGCTLHLKALNKPVLSEAVMNDRGESF